MSTTNCKTLKIYLRNITSKKKTDLSDRLRKTPCEGRWFWNEDNLWWKIKTTSHGRRACIEDDLKWNTVFYGDNLLEGDLLWKTTFYEIRPSMEDNFWEKMTFDWRQPWMEDEFWWMMRFDEKQFLIVEDLWMKMTFLRPLPGGHWLS